MTVTPNDCHSTHEKEKVKNDEERFGTSSSQPSPVSDALESAAYPVTAATAAGAAVSSAVEARIDVQPVPDALLKPSPRETHGPRGRSQISEAKHRHCRHLPMVLD